MVVSTPLPPKGLDLDTSIVAVSDIRAELIRMTEELGFCSTLRAPPDSAALLVNGVERHMPPNPYHNFQHIYDVAQFLFTLLGRSGLARPNAGAEACTAALRPLEVAALWAGCLCHDLDHPGHSCVLEEALGGPLHAAHAGAAPAAPGGFSLEWHHGLAARRLLCEELGLARGLGPEEAHRFQLLVVEVIDATDLGRHKMLSDSFQGVAASGLEGGSQEQRVQVMKWLMKCSDLANTVRPPSCRIWWENNAFEEFHREGDALLAGGVSSANELPALNDRRKGKREEASESFFRSLVMPTFALLEEFLSNTPGLNSEMATECLVVLKARLAMAVRDKEVFAHRHQRPRSTTLLRFVAVLLIPMFLVLRWSPLTLITPDILHTALEADDGLAHFDTSSWVPPLWSIIGVFLLGFPLVTLWEIYRNPVVKAPPKSMATPAKQTDALACLPDGVMLLEFVTGSMDLDMSHGMRRRSMPCTSLMSEEAANLDVGSGRLSRLSVGKKRRTRKLSNPEEAMTSTIWTQLARTLDENKSRSRGNSASPLRKLPSGDVPTFKSEASAGSADDLGTDDDEEMAKAEVEGAEAETRTSCREGVCNLVRRNLHVLMLCGSMVALSVLNKVLFRIVLCSVGRYVHALSSTTNVAYLFYAWTVVLGKARLGNEEQWKSLRDNLRFAAKRWRLFASMGICESMAFTLMPIGTPGLPKALAPVIAQSTLPVSMVLNAIFFKKRYSAVQMAGVGLIITGIAWATASENHMSDASLNRPLSTLVVPLFITTLSYFFLVISLIMKDVAFTTRANEGHQLDIFLLEGISGVGQAVALLLQWPMNFALLTELSVGEYFKATVSAFTDAKGLMPMLIFVYWAGNILYRLAMLRAMRQLSSLSTLLANVLTVPLSSLVFCLPLGLPLIGPPDQLSLLLILGTLLVCLGLVTFNNNPKCCQR